MNEQKPRSVIDIIITIVFWLFIIGILILAFVEW